MLVNVAAAFLLSQLRQRRIRRSGLIALAFAPLLVLLSLALTEGWFAGENGLAWFAIGILGLVPGWGLWVSGTIGGMLLGRVVRQAKET